MSGVNYLNIQNFDDFMNARQNLLERYNELSKEYDNIVEKLLLNWKGRGADAFRDEARNVKSNLAGIEDVLNTMCDILADCATVYKSYDSALGKANREGG